MRSGQILSILESDELDMNHGKKEGVEHSSKDSDLRDGCHGLTWSKPGLWRAGQFYKCGIQNDGLLAYAMLAQKGTQAIVPTKNVNHTHSSMSLSIFQSGQLLF